MRVYRLETEIRLPQPLERVFAFFADARNLEALTPPWLHFRLLTPAPIEMRRGLLIDYGLKLHGIPVRWQSEISAWDPPHLFIDEQRRGPYRRWIHRHRFTHSTSGTEVRDQVDYAVPGGALAHHLFVAPSLRRIFSYRHQALRRRFAAQTEGPTPVITIASRPK